MIRPPAEPAPRPAFGIAAHRNRLRSARARLSFGAYLSDHSGVVAYTVSGQRSTKPARR